MSEEANNEQNKPSAEQTADETKKALDDFSKKATDPPKTDDQSEALKKELEKAQAALNRYKQQEQEQADKEKTAAERLADREKELATVKRDNLISRVRIDNGFTDKVFDVVRPDGDDEASVKAAFEAHQESLNKWLESKGSKPGQGGGTETQAPKPQQGKTTESLPYLVRQGLIKSKSAI